MKEDVLFSIVIPIYNVEYFLGRCLSSLEAQSYRNFEVIMVNDCSPDKSEEICKEYLDKDSRFHYTKLKKNGGLSNARNQGFKYVNGDYVLFLDSDDYYDYDLLEVLYNQIKKQKSDLLIYGLIEEYYEKNQIKYSKQISMDNKTLITKESIDKEIIELETRTIFGYAWNKCYKASIIKKNDLKFETVSMVEDVLFNLSFIQYVQTLDILSYTPYHYSIRQSGSLTTKYLPDYFDTHSKRIRCFMNYYKISNIKEDVYIKLANIYNRYLLSALVRNCSTLSHMRYRDRKKWLADIFESDLYQSLHSFMKPSKRVLKFLHYFLIKQNILFSLVEARLIYFIKSTFPMLFAKLKQNR